MTEQEIEHFEAFKLAGYWRSVMRVSQWGSIALLAAQLLVYILGYQLAPGLLLSMAISAIVVSRLAYRIGTYHVIRWITYSEKSDKAGHQ